MEVGGGVEEGGRGARRGAGAVAPQHDKQLWDVPHCVDRQIVGAVCRGPQARARRRNRAGQLPCADQAVRLLLRDDRQECWGQGPGCHRLHHGAFQDAEATRVRGLPVSILGCFYFRVINILARAFNWLGATLLVAKLYCWSLSCFEDDITKPVSSLWQQVHDSIFLVAQSVLKLL